MIAVRQAAKERQKAAGKEGGKQGGRGKKKTLAADSPRGFKNPTRKAIAERAEVAEHKARQAGGSRACESWYANSKFWSWAETSIPGLFADTGLFDATESSGWSEQPSQPVVKRRYLVAFREVATYAENRYKRPPEVLSTLPAA